MQAKDHLPARDLEVQAVPVVPVVLVVQEAQEERAQEVREAREVKDLADLVAHQEALWDHHHHSKRGEDPVLTNCIELLELKRQIRPFELN